MKPLRMHGAKTREDRLARLEGASDEQLQEFIGAAQIALSTNFICQVKEVADEINWTVTTAQNVLNTVRVGA